MTYILGSRCKDGVVLVADRKLTYPEGSRYEYTDKLIADLSGVVIGFSGSLGTFEIFRTRISEYVIGSGGSATFNQLMLKLSEISYDLDHRYGSKGYAFDILVGLEGPDGSSLKHIYSNGLPEPVNRYDVIGTGSPYGTILLKTIWDQNMSMEQVAELGYFIVKYVESFKLDLTVGVDSQSGPYNKPQIWFIPDIGPDFQANPTLLDEFETKTKIRIDKVQEYIKSCYNGI
jgi:20S proteasome alpha/beta subunit